MWKWNCQRGACEGNRKQLLCNMEVKVWRLLPALNVERWYWISLPPALIGEYLRSLQEVQIANFLYLNGLDYEYERVYPFDSPSRNKKHTPDFYIHQGKHEARLEHYALTEKGYSNVLTEQEMFRYRKAIQDKRRIHKAHGTTLLETWVMCNDRRPRMDHLKETLEEVDRQKNE